MSKKKKTTTDSQVFSKGILNCYYPLRAETVIFSYTGQEIRVLMHPHTLIGFDRQCRPVVDL